MAFPRLQLGQIHYVKLYSVSIVHTEFDIRNSERDLLLVLDSIEKRGQTGGDLALNDRGSLLNGGSSTVELLESLQLEPA